MALDKDRLGDAIFDRIKLDFSQTLEAADEVQARNLFKAIADEVIKEIVAHLEVTTEVETTVPGTGLVAGITPVTGSATGTGEGIADPDSGIGAVS